MLGVIATSTACSVSPETPDTVAVFAAGSMARPLTAVLDSLKPRYGTLASVEFMGSLEAVRLMRDLQRVPDLLISADREVVESQLVPELVDTTVRFASNRVVLALAPASGKGINASNWVQVVSAGGVKIARADPARAPLGYRTQLVWQLAEQRFRRPGLAQALATASPLSVMRGNEADLVALLESGAVDGAWCYESLARAMRLPYILLGDSLDLGAPADASRYAQATVRIAGARPGDSVTVRGEPIEYVMAIPRGSAHRELAGHLMTLLLDSAAQRIMQREGLAHRGPASPVIAGRASR
jgi:molybdate/tungstate transport system substrate-binding protein